MPEGSEEARPGEDPGVDAVAGDIDQTLEEALARELSPVGGPLLPAESALPRRGSLADGGLAPLLAVAYRRAVSGRLLIEHTEQRDAGPQAHQQSVDLDCGWPVAATSTNPEHGLLAMLVRQGRITAEDRDRVRSEALVSGRRPGAIVLELGFLKGGELMPALRAQQEEILLAALALSEGTFSFDPESRADPSQIRLHRHPLALIRLGLERRGSNGHAPAEELLSRLGGAESRLCLVGGVAALDVLEHAAPRPGDRRLLALLDGVRPLGDVIRRGDMPEQSALALLFSLFAGGHVVPADQAHGRRVLRDRQLDRERILARASLVASGDYFEYLGVLPSASDQEITAALRRLDEDLEAAAADPEVQSGLGAELEAVQAVKEEAARVLGDPDLRVRYRAGRLSG